MRPLAGPVTLLVIVGGFLIFKLTSEEKAPTLEFTALEFAGADENHTGSCYSLSTVLIANRPYTGDAARTWTKPREGAWTLLLENVVNGGAGPVRVFRKYTFEKFGQQVRLVSMETSEGIPSDLAWNIDDLLDPPRTIKSTPVDRCLEPGATGYQFTPRR
jgi:hypothetical protein